MRRLAGTKKPIQIVTTLQDALRGQDSTPEAQIISNSFLDLDLENSASEGSLATVKSPTKCLS